MSMALTDELLNNDLVLRGTPPASAKLKLYRLSKNGGLQFLPDAYWQFMEKINGLYHDGIEIYGLMPPEAGLKDALAVNKEVNNPDIVLLGESEEDWLLFDVDEEEFKITDKEMGTVWKHSPEFMKILSVFLRV